MRDESEINGDSDVTRLDSVKPTGKMLDDGQCIGLYQVRRLLGRGRVSEVYQVEHTMLHSLHALKLINPEYTQRPGVRDLLRKEAAQAARLQHPNIVVVDDFGEIEGSVWLRMELIAGVDGFAAGLGKSEGVPYVSLADLLAAGEPLPIVTVLDLLGQILNGLAYAHGNGVIHRNLKLSNILLEASPDGSQPEPLRLIAKIADFSSLGSLVGEGSDLGADYMSPEQKRGELVDHRSDLYSLGLIVFHMLTGEPRSGLETLDDLLEDLDPVWDKWMQGALATSVDARFQTAGEMALPLGLVLDAKTEDPSSRVELSAVSPAQVDPPKGRIRSPSKRKIKQAAELALVASMSDQMLKSAYLKMKEIKYFIFIHVTLLVSTVMSVYVAMAMLGSGLSLVNLRMWLTMGIGLASCHCALARKAWHRPVLIALSFYMLVVLSPDFSTVSRLIEVRQYSAVLILLFVAAFPIFSAILFYRSQELFGADPVSYQTLQAAFKSRGLRSRIAINAVFFVFIILALLPSFLGLGI